MSVCLAPDAAGVKTAAASSTAAMLETLSKKKPERDTVYLDLRGFEQHRAEEQERMASVSRVLGLHQERWVGQVLSDLAALSSTGWRSRRGGWDRLCQI